MSCLEHKEWRFVVYVVPALTVGAAGGVVAVGALCVPALLSSPLFHSLLARRSSTDSLSPRRSTASPLIRRLLLLSLLALNALQTLLGLAASAHNYPGADALAFLEAHLPARASGEPWSVHVGTAAKMTGASNFLVLDSALAPHADDGDAGAPRRAWYLAPQDEARERAAVVYDRAEPPRSWASYDFALVGASTSSSSGEEGDEALPPGAEVLYTASEFGGWDVRALLRGGWREVRRRRDAVRVVRLPEREKGSK